jgi:hypothetical protein
MKAADCITQYLHKFCRFANTSPVQQQYVFIKCTPSGLSVRLITCLQGALSTVCVICNRFAAGTVGRNTGTFCYHKLATARFERSANSARYILPSQPGVCVTTGRYYSTCKLDSQHTAEIQRADARLAQMKLVFLRDTEQCICQVSLFLAGICSYIYQMNV